MKPYYHGVDQEFKNKLLTVEQALEKIHSGYNLVCSMAAAEPFALMEGIGKRSRDLTDVTLNCANPSKEYECFTDDTLAGHLNAHVMFVTSPIRSHQGRGRVHYIPQHLSNWTRNVFARRPVDVFWGVCTPIDKRGFVSLGPGCVYESDILRNAKKVILEVNPNLPLTLGATHVPISWVDHFVENEHVLPTMGIPKLTERDYAIGRYVADLIEDGSTIQLGIGSIPNAIGLALESKKDLGVHTELINDTMMDLFNKGVVSGRKKTLWPGKMVGCFVFGTEKLYKFVDKNPTIELQPGSITNNPHLIAKNNKMISVNTAVEIDITGQVCSESVGHRELSGVGGASDTHIGAQRSKGGRGIIAVWSVTKDEKHSKIVFELKPGAKVSISRNDIDTVVTEYGVAKLAGRTVSERAKSLIGIAHPKYRDKLLSDAKNANYI